MAESIEDLDLTPPQAAQDNAEKVLEWRDEHGEDVNGMTRTGWVRANQLAEGEELSPDIVKRMAQFNRHRGNSDISEEYEGEPWKDAGHVAWLGWGGDEGVDWAMRMSDRITSMENSGRDKVTTLSHKHDEQTMENASIVDGIMKKTGTDSQTISKNTFNGYFQDAPEFEDENWQSAVDRLTEIHGMIRSYITSVVRHEASGHGREELVPPFEDPIDTDTLIQFSDNIEENVEDDTYRDLVQQLVAMDESLRKIFYDTVVHHSAMHGGGEVDVSQLLGEELQEYESMQDCMEYHVDEEGYEVDQAYAMCSSKMDLEEHDKKDLIKAFGESRTLQQGIIPDHRPLGDFGTRESESWDRPDYSEFQSAYDFDESFAELSEDDKRVVAAHFGRVDNTGYEDATFSDLQLPHHHPDNGDVDRAAVIAARQRLPQSDMPQEDLEAIDTHLANHLRDDFGEEDVEPIIEKENAVERENVFVDADKAVAKARDMGIRGIHTIREDGETLYKPGATPEDFEQAKRESSEALSEGQLVSFQTEYGKSFGRVRENTEQTYEVEVYQAELGGGWKSSGKTEHFEEKELSEEDQFPDSLNDVFNNGSTVGTATVDEKESEDLEQQEMSEDDPDDGSDEEVTQSVEPSKTQQVKKK